MRARVETALGAPENLLHLLRSYRVWPFERVDLAPFATILDAFDNILLQYIESNSLGDTLAPAQDAQPSPPTELIVQILTFSSQLLNSAKDPSVYNSIDVSTQL
jgi:hypothetical protein